MSQRTYYVISVAGLVPVVLATAWLGPRIAGFLAGLSPDVSGLLTVLGWLIALLLPLAGLAAALSPLRARAGIPDVVGEVRRGGTTVLAEKLSEEAEKARSTDPATRRKHHLGMAAAGAILSAAAIFFTWGAWVDGQVFGLALAGAILMPLFTIYHLFRAAVPSRPQDG